MSRMPFMLPMLLLVLTASAYSAPSHASLIQADGPGANDTFSGSDCGGRGGFSNCYATTTGTQQGATVNASPAIYKRNSSDNLPTGGEEFGSFASITGAEFSISYDGTTHVLSFTYTPGAGDPPIHYFTIKKSNDFVLFYDLNPITSAMIDLDGYFPSPGWGHITFFDTGATPCEPRTPGCGGSVDPIPEPLSLGLFAIGLAGVVFARRIRAKPRKPRAGAGAVI